MSPATITELLSDRARNAPDHPQYRLLGRDDASTLTLEAVQRTATQVAASLASRYPRGSRAILLTPAPGACIAGFFGACGAGLIPVPVAPPGRSRLDRGLAPLRAIVDDCTPVAIITTNALRSRILASLSDGDPLTSMGWESVEDLTAESAAAHHVLSSTCSDDVAYLQYTSGSTAAPKGVQVTHGAVMANLANIHNAFEHKPSDHAMMWLPSHHDMGLVGGILEPLYSRMRVTLAMPQQLLQSPARWLQWISESGATLSGGPDFAYRLCVDRIRDDQLDGVDLSRWRLAFTGAEPIRADTIDAFAERFAPIGFDRGAFYPCYGLAEATLIVTGGQASDPPRTVNLSRTGLYRHQATPPQDVGDTRTVVSCGSAISEADEVIVVDPDTHSRMPDDAVGEIWYRGPSMARGYHGQTASTASTFNAELAGHPGAGWLRTGDLGFIRDGELFVTGRRRETIVIRGKNLDAADIDQAAQGVISTSRLGLVAALNPIVDGEECLVITIEAGKAARDEEERLVQDVQAELAIRFGVRAHEVILVRPGALPRTTSGKLRRAAAVQAYERGTMRTLVPSA